MRRIILEAIRRESIEKVVTVKLDVDIAKMFGRYCSELENWNRSFESMQGQQKGELEEKVLAVHFICVQ